MPCPSPHTGSTKATTITRTDSLQLRQLLAIKPEQTVVFERFSDSAGGYITLDPNNPQVFKTLIRAAKAKLKLRLKATVSPLPEPVVAEAVEMPEEKTKSKPMEPVITRSPSSQTSTRESTAMDGRSVGTGIFEFREARASHQSLVDVSEAPVPLPFKEPTLRTSPDFAETLRSYPHPMFARGMRPIPFRTREAVTPALTRKGHPWSVHCNECDVAMANAHFHCNICDGGDYDLCEDCVAGGKLCPGEGHWLIKRFVQNGVVISSTTETISPRKKAACPETEIAKDIPGAFTEETKTLAEPMIPTRTCNSCIIVLPEREFVTCQTCEDFDLCVKCHSDNKHGHHPSHPFKPATEDTFLSNVAESLLAPGRNNRHNAICDGCDKKIYGVRHKCLNCPDWDYCGECYSNAGRKHPGHRFAPLYESIPEPLTSTPRHDGIFCDGPLCKDKARNGYIYGVRYKCAVCHDTDFCAQCEAMPNNEHNRTHPLIKFKTAVRNVSITTENEEANGQTRMVGDRRPTSMRSAATETAAVPQANAATQVQTVAEIKPTEAKQVTQPIPVVQPAAVRPTAPKVAVHPSLLQAHFVQDSMLDGTAVEPGTRFTQMWTMRNPGPFTWPAGCSVRFVGGDNMLNLDNNHPMAVSDVNNASESNVLGRDVPMGEEVAFKITLKAPMREGKSISYWRMKTAEGTPFGHRLWCDIEVKKAEVVTPPAPAPVFAAPSMNMNLQAQMQRQRQLAMMAQQQQQAAMLARQTAMSGPPPPYQDAAITANIPARIAALREQQVKKRELMMREFNKHAQSSATPHKQVTIEEPNTEEKARKDAARQRVEHIKAKILRAREEQAKAMEVEKKKAEAKAVALAEQMRAAEELEKAKKEAREKVQKMLDGLAEEKKLEKETVEEKTEDLEGSQMVFPKLDKESPASSTYESIASSSKGKAAYVENEQGEIEHSATPSVASPTPVAAVPDLASPAIEEAFDLGDDIEVLSFHDGEESEDEGFLTDEEYDILDASDSETVKSN